MNRDNKTFCLVGEALYGPFWQTQLAEDLKVAVRTCQRWAAGKFNIPPHVWQELETLCRRRGLDLTAKADRLASTSPRPPDLA